MKLNKIIRIVMATVLSTITIYFTLVLREKIEFSTEHFFRYFVVWGTFLFFSISLISYYSPYLDSEDKKTDREKIISKKKKVKKRKK